MYLFEEHISWVILFIYSLPFLIDAQERLQNLKQCSRNNIRHVINCVIRLVYKLQKCSKTEKVVTYEMQKLDYRC